MFDKLVMLTDGQTIYRGQVKTLVPFLAGMGLECPSYHNPVGKMLNRILGPKDPRT
jgi:ATP-binding cassette subfamily G (WHITE) protein 1